MSLSRQDLVRFARLIFDKTGLLFPYEQYDFLASRISERIRATGAPDPKFYYDSLWFTEGGDAELAVFLDTVLVNETYFFRSMDQLHAFSERVLRPLHRERDEIRIWSAGCATGEEVYSLAILCETLLPGARYLIFGTDISTRALRKAQAGVYGGRSVHLLDAETRERFFEEAPDGLHVRDEIRNKVRFRYLNLVNQSFPGDWDIVFCRNVLYYFPHRVREQVVRKFHGALIPGGHLVVSTSESLRDFEALFRAESRDGYSFYEKWTTDRRDLRTLGGAKKEKPERRESHRRAAGTVRVRAEEGRTVIRLNGAFDLEDPAEVEAVENEILHALPSPAAPPGEVRFDLVGVPYLSNAALDLLRKVAARAKEMGTPRLSLEVGERLLPWVGQAGLSLVYELVSEPLRESSARGVPREEGPARPQGPSDPTDRPSHLAPPSFDYREEDGASLLVIKGHFDAALYPFASERLVEELKPLLGRACVRIDLCEVTFLSRDVCTVLRRALQVIRGRGGRMALRASPGPLAEFLRRSVDAPILTARTVGETWMEGATHG